MRILSILGFLTILGLLASTTVLADPIEDNSFLIEEAYNQEEGIVQHINAYFYNQKVHSWDDTFTQEWPAPNQEHQLSYTIPISRTGDPHNDIGVGDVLLNYRYQAADDERLAFAPRFSLLLPTGNSDKELGSGQFGYQINFPLSIKLSSNVVLHYNLGSTFTPDSRAPNEKTADTIGFNYGASVIYHVSDVFDLMFEAAGLSDESVQDDSETVRNDSFFINPGFRSAINFACGLQIVPGIAFPIGLGPSEGEHGFIGYLSFEHPF